MPPQPPGNTPSGRKQRSIHAEAADENAKAVHDKEKAVRGNAEAAEENAKAVRGNTKAVQATPSQQTKRKANLQFPQQRVLWHTE